MEQNTDRVPKAYGTVQMSVENGSLHFIPVNFFALNLETGEETA